MLAIFILSGFAGLIYQSIWSHYLGLFLGHAAYAQALVLAIFMGGMAAGAAWIAHAGQRWRNLIRWYALIEAVIGLLGLLFHWVFGGVTAFSYEWLIPTLGAPAAIDIARWLIAVLLILPQTILLGMTFPLMSGGLIRRSVLWFSLTGMVSSQSKNPEAAYLLLQWLGSARIYAWMTANPGGYFDPFRLSDFKDPLVRQTYHAYHMDVVRETVARTVPTINYAGATAYHNALVENLMAALTGAKSPEEAMADVEAQWSKITRRTGEEKVIEAIKANRAGWPTVVDAL